MVKNICNLTPIFVAKFNLKTIKIYNEERLIDYSNIYSIDRLNSSTTLEGGESVTIGNEFKLFNIIDKSEIFSLNLADLLELMKILTCQKVVILVKKLRT